jgi:outer membrane receptor for ferrienterochelin and colicins
LRRAALLLVLWAAAGGLALAQTPAPAPAPAPAPLASTVQTVTVEGQSLDDADRRRESTIGMTVVGREELDQYGDTSILDVLQRLPGITIDGDAPRLRGLGGGYTLILLNGEPAPPGFSLDSLSPGEIERIEVIKGPTAEYGGVAGTINVILRNAPRFRQREVRMAAGYRALAPQGSLSASWGDRVGDIGFHVPLSVSSWANATHSQTDRLSRLPSGELREQQVRGRDESRGGGVNFSPRLDIKLSSTDQLQWQAFVQRNESRNRSARDTAALSGPPITTVQDASQSFGNWQMLRTQLQWVRKRPDGLRLELKAAVQVTAQRSASDGLGRDALGAVSVLRNNFNSQRSSQASTGGRVRWPLGDAFGGGHTLAGGWDFEDRQRRELSRYIENGVEQITGNVGVPFTASVRRATMFLQDEWTLSEQWSFTIGLRAEQVRTQTATPVIAADSQYGALLPVVHLRHAFDPKGRDVLRLSLSRSLRVPDVNLLLPRYSLNGAYPREQANTPIAPDSAGNPALQPEYATGLELALERQLPGGGVLSAGLFHRQIDDLIRRRITLETVAESPVQRWVSRPANIGRATSTGVELEVKGRAEQLLPAWLASLVQLDPGPAKGRGPGLQLRAALSVYRSAVEQIDDPNARIEGQAPWTATVGFDHALRASIFSYGANLGLTPAFSTQQTDRQRVWRSQARRFDAYALWRFNKEVQLRVAANNLVPEEALSSSRVADLDGFAASSFTRRDTVTQFNANLLVRF